MIRRDRVRLGKPCQHCQKPVAGAGHGGRPHALGRRRFCSTACWYAWRRARPKRPCPVCGEPIRGTMMKTCGARCGYEYRKAHSRRPVTCKGCGAEFRIHNSAVTRRYCTEACHRRHKALKPVACEQCGAKFLRKSAFVRRSKRLFCSPACVAAGTKGARHPMFRTGVRENGRGKGWVQRAERIRQRDGYCCLRCGKSQAENARKLSVDHIVPWRVFSDEEKHLANADGNLASLCTSCHSWKTSRAEQKWLRGDRLDFKRYEQALALTSAARGIA